MELIILMKIYALKRIDVNEVDRIKGIPKKT